MPDEQFTKIISARLSLEQYNAVLELIGDERPSDYLRRLIEQDFERHNQLLPDYRFVDNEMRSKHKIRGRGD